MALKMNTVRVVSVVSYNANTGAEIVNSTDEQINNAYIIVSDVRGNKNKCTITLDAFRDSGKNADDLLWHRMYSFTPSVGNNSQNFIRQAYTYLKTLPEYSNAEDC